MLHWHSITTFYPMGYKVTLARVKVKCEIAFTWGTTTIDAGLAIHLRPHMTVRITLSPKPANDPIFCE